MKRTWMLKICGLLTLTLFLAACQEKVAPELSDPGSATAQNNANNNANSENRFYLELSEAAPSGVKTSLLGYALHKANEVATSECQVSDVDDVPTTLDSTRDITCFLEAEELALHHNGFAVKAHTDAGVCDYIVNEPYSYYKRQPGISGRMDGSPRQMVFFNCSSEAITAFGGDNVANQAINQGYGANNSAYKTLNQVCGKYFNIDDDGVTDPDLMTYGDLHLSATAEPISADDVSDMCSFNYTDDNILCDEGEIVVHTVSIGFSDPDTNVVGDEVQTIGYGDKASTECGGNVKACLAGGVIDVLTTEDILQKGYSETISAFESVVGSTEMTIQKSFQKRYSNIHASNFMRQCSGLPNFTTNANFNTLLTGYDPDTMEEYSLLGTTVPGTQEKDETTGQMDVIILADDPFRAGIDVNLLPVGDVRRKWTIGKMGTRPNYTFLCLDKAYDVKARIRLSVREWNRNFSPSTQEFRYISDIFSINAKMDATGSQINPAQSFNDYDDWDDKFTFFNSATNSCALSGADTGIYPAKSAQWFPSDDEIIDN